MKFARLRQAALRPKFLRQWKRWSRVFGVSLLLTGCSAGSGPEIQLASLSHQPVTIAANADVNAVAPIRELVLRHAPYKQVAPDSGKPNTKIGRTPGSACEVIRFLTLFSRADPSDAQALAKAKSLADWVISLQETNESSMVYGGVPSTPDLAPPANRYFYAIDAGFCGTAMFELYDLTKDEKYARAGLRFADFLVNMQSGSRRPYARPAGMTDGFCEFIVDAGPEPAWNCDRHVKTLSALPVLRRASIYSGKPHYEAAAASARAFLVPGLAGAWEHADAAALSACRERECPNVWRRIKGPNGEPDYFVYGDTLAYALRGLFEYEGPSSDVRRLYQDFSSYRGNDPKTQRYDGRIAFAGYLHPASRSPDPLSGYYDLVTLGILHGLRRNISPDHYAVADRVLRTHLANAAQLSWRMEMDLSMPESEFVDLTTLANIGEALLMPPAAARP